MEWAFLGLDGFFVIRSVSMYTYIFMQLWIYISFLIFCLSFCSILFQGNRVYLSFFIFLHTWIVILSFSCLPSYQYTHSLLELSSCLFLVCLTINTHTLSSCIYVLFFFFFNFTLVYRIGLYYTFFSVSCFSHPAIIRTASKSICVTLSHSFNGHIKYGIIYEIIPWCS